MRPPSSSRSRRSTGPRPKPCSELPWPAQEHADDEHRRDDGEKIGRLSGALGVVELVDQPGASDVPGAQRLPGLRALRQPSDQLLVAADDGAVIADEIAVPAAPLLRWFEPVTPLELGEREGSGPATTMRRLLP